MDDKALGDTWLMFRREHGCSIDRMLCSPQLRQEFLEAARQVTGCDDEEPLLWTLVNLRKRKRFADRSATPWETSSECGRRTERHMPPVSRGEPDVLAQP